METIGYGGGFRIYLYLRKRWPAAAVPIEANLWLLVGAVFGALIGSKLLAWYESWPEYLAMWRNSRDLSAALGGKTIVGGLLGGWAGVEFAKWRLGIRHSTGDVFVFPLIFGMSVGRTGCFLTGLPDHTFGNHTSLPWAVNFGDGPRHPTQLYDIIFLCLLGIALRVRMCWPYPNGRIFRLFVLSYCVYRLCVEFIKPTFRPYLGLSAIQLACVGGAVAAGWAMTRKAEIDASAGSK